MKIPNLILLLFVENSAYNRMWSIFHFVLGSKEHTQTFTDWGRKMTTRSLGLELNQCEIEEKQQSCNLIQLNYNNFKCYFEIVFQNKLN